MIQGKIKGKGPDKLKMLTTKEMSPHCRVITTRFNTRHMDVTDWKQEERLEKKKDSKMTKLVNIKGNNDKG